MQTKTTPFILITIFMILLLLGVNAGEVAVVLEKATTICLSCMGIG